MGFLQLRNRIVFNFLYDFIIIEDLIALASTFEQLPSNFGVGAAPQKIICVSLKQLLINKATIIFKELSQAHQQVVCDVGAQVHFFVLTIVRIVCFDEIKLMVLEDVEEKGLNWSSFPA